VPEGASDNKQEKHHREAMKPVPAGNEWEKWNPVEFFSLKGN
jgi:hypothetical protein